MNTIRSILVPVDFSDQAAETYQYALHFADKFSASIHLVYSMPTVPAVTTHPDLFMDMTKELLLIAEGNLQSFQRDGIGRAKYSLSKTPIVSGAVSVFGLKESVEKQCKEHNVDLVLMGTHGVQDAWDRLFGTNAAFLAGKIETPLLILPVGTEYHPFKSICFATDFRDRDLKSATLLLKSFYPFLPQMHFLHVQNPEEEPPVESIDFFRRAFERPQQGMAATFTTVTHYDVTDGVFNYLDTHQHDLLVMIKTNRGWWSRMLSHSETRETAGITNVPLLILGEYSQEE